jgi:hypothetical protein
VRTWRKKERRKLKEKFDSIQLSGKEEGDKLRGIKIGDGRKTEKGRETRKENIETGKWEDRSYIRSKE